MSKPEWAKTLERIADALDRQKILDGPTRIPGRLTVKWIKDLREIAAMDLAPLEKSGVCETCESEAVKRVDSLESDLDVAIDFRKSRERELGNRIAEQDDEIRQLKESVRIARYGAADLVAEKRMLQERIDSLESQIADFETTPDDCAECEQTQQESTDRIRELESALRQLDEIRHAWKRGEQICSQDLKKPCMVLYKRKNVSPDDTKCTICGTRKAVVATGELDCPRCTALGITRASDTRCPTCGTSKAIIATGQWDCPRCSGAWGNQNPRMSETDCPCNECALEDPHVDIAACREDVLARDDESCGYPRWLAERTPCKYCRRPPLANPGEMIYHGCRDATAADTPAEWIKRNR